MQSTQDIIKGVKIPPQPHLLQEIQAELQRPNANLTSIGKLISNDVALSAAVLKTINSPFFGRGKKISSIPQAIVLLGVKATLSLVTGFALRQSFDQQGLSLPRFWDAATNCARLSAFAARHLGLMEPDSPYTLGLFHDVGIPLMAQRFPDYLDTLKQANEAETGLFTDTENQRYGADHTVIGYIVCRDWGLPPEIRQALRSHHDLEACLGPKAPHDDPANQMVALLKLAECGDSLFRTDQPDKEWQRFGPLVLEFLCLSEDDANELFEDMRDLLLSGGD
ncbi:MAG: HDOD domain-containing protein [Gammaproteobacteria bacterium SHHR-1]|uniref:HDOD domain-containing protein n=1 Tax=Magnetovirga frankeli TaxID=947516 RepID=UPI001293189B|nr:HDOD domain-containing protein [gamma proteobacterium SS-5]